jgi:hypothetical protein
MVYRASSEAEAQEPDSGIDMESDASVKTGFAKGLASAPKPRAGSEGLASTL